MQSTTDSSTSRGTGQLARSIAAVCAEHSHVLSVTRHQLDIHDATPYTSHNSCAVIHLGGNDRVDADCAGRIAEEVVLADFIEGSDPSLCWAVDAQVAPSLVAYGHDAQQIVLTRERGQTLGNPLEGLGGTRTG